MVYSGLCRFRKNKTKMSIYVVQDPDKIADFNISPAADGGEEVGHFLCNESDDGRDTMSEASPVEDAVGDSNEPSNQWHAVPEPVSSSVKPPSRPRVDDGWVSNTPCEPEQDKDGDTTGAGPASFELMEDVIEDCEPLPGPGLVVKREDFFDTMDEIAPDYRAACGATDVDEYLNAAVRAGSVRIGGEGEEAWVEWVGNEEKVATPAPQVAQPEPQPEATPDQQAAVKTPGFDAETRTEHDEFVQERSPSPEVQAAEVKPAATTPTPTPAQRKHAVLLARLAELPEATRVRTPSCCFRPVMRIDVGSDAGTNPDLKKVVEAAGDFRSMIDQAVKDGVISVGGKALGKWVAPRKQTEQPSPKKQTAPKTDKIGPSAVKIAADSPEAAKVFEGIRRICASHRAFPVDTTLPPNYRAISRSALTTKLQNPRGGEGLKEECTAMGGIGAVIEAAVGAGVALAGDMGPRAWVAADVSGVPQPDPTPAQRKHAVLLARLAELPEATRVRTPSCCFRPVMRIDVGSDAGTNPDLKKVVEAAGDFRSMIDQAVKDGVISVGGKASYAWVAPKKQNSASRAGKPTPPRPAIPLLSVAAADTISEAMRDLSDDVGEEEHPTSDVLGRLVDDNGDDVLQQLGFDNMAELLTAARRARLLTVSRSGAAESVSFTIPPDPTRWRPLLTAIRACPPVPASTAAAYGLPLHHVVLRSKLGVQYQKIASDSLGMPMSAAVKEAEAAGVVITGGRDGFNWVAAPLRD